MNYGKLSPKTMGIEGCVEALESERIAIQNYILELHGHHVEERKNKGDLNKKVFLIGKAIQRINEIGSRLNFLMGEWN